MRKLTIFTALAAFLMTSLLSAGQITKTYEFDEPLISQVGEYQQVIMLDCQNIANPGEPDLPRKGVSLLLPPGEEAVSISFMYGDKLKLEGNFFINPFQRGYPIGYNGEKEVTQPEPSIYNSNDKYPENTYGSLSTHFMRGHGKAYADICPFEYYPESGELYYFTNIKVIIETAGTDKAQTAYSKFLRTDKSTNNRLRETIDNSELITRLYGETITDTKDGEYDYLIITDDQFYDAVLALANYKNHCGMLTEIILIDSIEAEYSGSDTQEKMRNCIIDQYEAAYIEYVLLAGDNEILPHRGLFDDAGGYENEYDIPADIYFSNLDGNWNTDGDSQWGEPGEDDLDGEVYIGRLAIDSETEITNFVNKSIIYQSQPCISSIEHALMTGEDLGWEVWGKDYKEEIRLGSHNWGYTTAGIPANIDVQTLYDYDDTWSGIGDLVPSLNNGLNLVNHLGHANNTYMMKLYNIDISNGNFTNDGIENGFYIIYSQGCYCGAFDNRDPYGSYGNDCISEKWTTIEHGPVAIVSNSRYGWGSLNNTNGSSQYYDRQFFDAIFGEDITRIGAAQNDSKVDNNSFIGYGQNRWCYYCSNLFGEPTLDIWTALPAVIEANHAGVVLIGQEDFQINVADIDGDPIVNALIGLSFNDVCVGRGYTDEFGDATIEFFVDIDQAGDMDIIITGHNLTPYEETIEVIPPEGPYMTFALCLIDDDENGNGNGLLDFGETVELLLSLENVGIETAENVYSIISCDDFEYFEIIDNQADFGNVAAGEIVQSDDVFMVSISSNCPDNHQVRFTITTYADNYPDEWTQSFTLINHSPVLACVSIEIDDSNGNNNGVIDPGESIELQLNLLNEGSCEIDQFDVLLFTNDTCITIDQNSSSVDSIPVGETSQLVTPLEISAPISCPNPYIFGLTISLLAPNGYFCSFPLSLQVGGFTDDIEAGEGNWTHYANTSGFTDQWHRTDARNHSPNGSYSWKCGGSGTGNYDNLLDAALVTPEVSIGENCVLRYWQRINSETSNSYPGYAYDAGKVELFFEGADSWGAIEPVDGYPYLIRTGGNPGPFPAETACFAGSENWHLVEFDLSEFANLPIQIKFRFGSDGSVAREGWYIDDVRITSGSIYAAPLELEAGINEYYQIYLTWQAPEESSPIGYNLYRSNESGNYGSTPINSEPITTLSFTDLVFNTDNYYVATALYEDGMESHYSNESYVLGQTSIDDEKQIVPDKFELLQNYPNPFNPSTTIKFNLAKSSYVAIDVYDILGRKVETLVSKQMPAGFHHVVWNAGNISSGMYFYRIEAGDFVATKKMVMLK
ncbi:MAG: T9SS type A sorting domain-containing protein [candidate division Zixibacteria bacterium]|nr:T9SS type A sorting domain-containing protein [candidate division Zixibacteria bacterium]